MLNLLIDGNSMARPRFEVDGHLRAFHQKLEKLEEIYSPQKTFIAWDSNRRIRQERYPFYKANRIPGSGVYKEEIAKVQRALPKRIRQIDSDGWEADDVLYSISVEVPGEKVIVSGDKDLFQTISHDTSVHRLRSKGKPDEVYHKDNIVLLTGLTPLEWTWYLTLKGDPVDCIPGLPKVGEKRAKDIILACPSFVDSIVHENDDQARRDCAKDATLTKYCELAIAHREDLKASLWLVLLHKCWEEPF